VASWVVLGGRCRTCKTKISVRYPLVELATAGLFVAAALRFGADWVLPAFCLFLAALLALALIDLEWFLLPSRIIYPTLLASAPLLLLAAVAGHDWTNLRHAIVGSAAAFLAFFVLNLVYPKGMAFGDVRLSAVVGLYLGWLGLRHVFLGLFLAFLTATFVGVALILARRADRKSPIPFGIFLAIGAAITVFAGDPIVRWWTG
jgi:leader peptidase (prepilin peptidase)/N-methyltransferase